MSSQRRCDDCGRRIGYTEEWDTCRECGATLCEDCGAGTFGDPLCNDCADLFGDEDGDDENGDDENGGPRCNHQGGWVPAFDPRYERCERCGEVRKAGQAVK